MKITSLHPFVIVFVVIAGIGLVLYRLIPILIPKMPDDAEIFAQVKERIKDKQIEQKDKYVKEIEGRIEKLKNKDKDDDVNALVYTAVYYNNLGEKKLALDYYERALEKDPKNRMARANLASIYEDLNLWEKAEEQYLKLLDDYPTYTPGYRSLAYLYQYRFPNPDTKILPIFEKGLNAANNHPDLLNWLIAYYQEAGRPEKAVPFSIELARQLNKQQGTKKEVPGLEIKVK